MQKDVYELTNPQKSILLTEQFFQHTSVNNICGTLVINDDVDFRKLYEALLYVVKHNDAFNIRFHIDEKTNKVFQTFEDFSPIDREIIELDTENDLKIYEKKLVLEEFQIFDNPLYKFVFFRYRNSNRGGIILNIHHLISDAATLDMITRKIIQVYSALINKEPIPDVSSSYLDFINNEKNYLLSDRYKSDKSYWDSTFEEIPELITFSNKTSENHTLSSNRISYVVPSALMKDIKGFCQTNKISLYNFWTAIYSIYFGKIKELDSFTIGTPILNRLNYKEKNTVGMFISTVPLKIDLKCSNNFIDFVKSIFTSTMQMLRHQRYPYQELLADLRKNDNNIPNLYNIMISYQDTKTTVNDSGINYYTKWTKSSYTLDELDIHLFDMNDTGNTHIAYDYQIDNISSNDIHEMHRNILNLAKQIVVNHSYAIDKLSLVDSETESKIISDYNNTKTYKINSTVLEKFKENALNNPDKLCIKDKSKSVSYGEFLSIINNMSKFLAKKGIEPKDKVCLFMPNSINLLSVIYSALNMRACYIPIDVSYPEDRLSYIFKNSKSKFIITDKESYSKLGKLQESAVVIDYADFVAPANLKVDSKNKGKMSDLAYIIYTSGSTGKPKGVKITNESLSNYIFWASKFYANEEPSNFSLYSSCSFDLTVTSIFVPLVSNNTIYVYRDNNIQLLLEKMFSDNKVQIVKLTPAHLTLLKDINVKETAVKKLIVGGDILHTEICNEIVEKFDNDITIYNEYGPTETTVGCMIYEYDKFDDYNYSSVPIGIPIDNTSLYVLNKDLNVLPYEQKGHLYIAGTGLSKGYINAPDKNKEMFIYSDKFNCRMYNSGDIVILHRNNVMEYIGRSDFQVKINGYRIEIGEIQKNILSFPGIKDVYVNILDKNDKKYICAYYVTSKRIKQSDLKAYLMNNLTNYMIPKYFIELDSIPLTNNGKVNKKLLPLPETSSDSRYEAPDNDLEKSIHDAFCKVLEIDRISTHHNFFDYYVDSLAIIRIQTMLKKENIDIDSQAFYDYPSIKMLADYISSKQDNKNNSDNESLLDNISKIQIPLEDQNKRNYKNILLFGATGFLGIHILISILRKTKAHVHCVVREKYNLSALERLIKKIEFYFGHEEYMKYHDRIHVIPGTLLNEKFDLDDSTYENLGGTIDCVVSTAAIVKHYGNYQTFYETNVLGTKYIIAFCEKYNIPFNYTSTLSVSGYCLVDVPENSVFTENDFYIGQKYEDNVYVKSKFEAEKLILNEVQKGLLKASIYRVGNITNRYTDGVFQENYKENAFINRLLAILDLKEFPKTFEAMELNFSPVDVIADFMVQLMCFPKNNINVYHIYNNAGISIKHLLKLLKEIKISVKLSSLTSFENKINEDSTKYFGFYNYIKTVKENGISSILLSNSVTQDTLISLDLQWPEITDEYLLLVINYLLSILK